MSVAVASAESAALAGLSACVDTILAEVERLLAAEQKPSDFRPPSDGALPDHRPTSACQRVVQYLARIVEAVQTALEGLNKQSFLAKLVRGLGLRNGEMLLSECELHPGSLQSCLLQSQGSAAPSFQLH
jgi:hypothetical protein